MSDCFKINLNFRTIIPGMRVNFYGTSYGQRNNVILMEGLSAGVFDNNFDYTQSGIQIITSSTLKNKIALESDLFVLEQGYAQALIGPRYALTDNFHIFSLTGLVNLPGKPS